MRKAMAGHLRAGKRCAAALCSLLRGMLFIGFSIQIGLGVLWICCNFTSVQEFTESRSVVYGAVYALTGRHAPVMYGLQLALAYYAGCCFLGALRPAGRFWRVWSSLALLTFPMAMQCHLALLPWSFAGSFVLLEWSFAVKILRESAAKKTISREGASWHGEGADKRLFAGLGGCWLVLAALLPEYRLLGGIPAALSLVFCLWKLRKEAKKMLYPALVTVVIGCLAVGAGTAAQKVSGAEERSASFALVCRTAWPFILSDFSGWPEEVQAVLAQDMRELTFCPDNMDRIMKPLMEAAFGSGQADAYYREIAENAWTHRASVILTHMRWDVLGYGMTPVILQEQLRGGCYDSYSGRNYEIMRNHTPSLTKHYVRYSCWWFGVCIVLALLLTVAYCAQAKGFIWRDLGKGLWVCILSAGVLVAWYTMQGSGIMDYKASFAVSSLWLIWALTAMREEGTIEDRQTFSGEKE